MYKICRVGSALFENKKKDGEKKSLPKGQILIRSHGKKQPHRVSQRDLAAADIIAAVVALAYECFLTVYSDLPISRLASPLLDHFIHRQLKSLVSHL